MARPFKPFYISIILKENKGIKTIYNNINKKNEIIYKKEKWHDELLTVLANDSWQQIFLNCFQTIHDNYLSWFQYKIITRILGTSYKLYKMNIIDTPNCRLCNIHEETITHLFCECIKTIELWENLYTWIQRKIGINIILTKTDIIMGILIANDNSKPLNMIIINTKAYIFRCAGYKRNLNILELQWRIKKSYEEQRALAMVKQNIGKFDRIWNIWKFLFDNI